MLQCGLTQPINTQYVVCIMNMPAQVAPLMDFRTAYSQLDRLEKAFTDGFVSDVEHIAESTGARLLAVLQQPWPFPLDQRSQALLARPLIRAAIAERVRALAELTNISEYKTLKELTAIAYSNINDYITINAINGEPQIDLTDVTPEKMAAIKSFEIEDKPRGGRKIKFVLHDKLAALAMVARHQGLLTDGNLYHQQAKASEKPVNNSLLPADADDDAAARLYSLEINGA